MKGSRSFLLNTSNFATAKYRSLKINLPISLHTCTPLSELPSNISTMIYSIIKIVTCRVLFPPTNSSPLRRLSRWSLHFWPFSSLLIGQIHYLCEPDLLIGREKLVLGALPTLIGRGISSRTLFQGFFFIESEGEVWVLLYVQKVVTPFNIVCYYIKWTTTPWPDGTYIMYCSVGA